MNVLTYKNKLLRKLPRFKPILKKFFCRVDGTIKQIKIK